MRLAILGASGHGKVVADAATLSDWSEVVFFDDAWPNLTQNGPWRVAGGSRELMTQATQFDGVIVAIGNNRVRNARQRELKDAGLNVVSVIHPSAVISPHASIGVGAVIFAGAVINACARVGAGSIVNTGAVVEHDCSIGEYSHLSPNSVLAGGVSAGRMVWVGAGASIKQLVVLGDEVSVGMGSVVLNDVPAGQTVVGVPARLLNSQN
ncbi:sugar O-acyltransferase (sialic acid O-acetyltransferase NeuD family) [Marinobacter pelagius]|uniref:Sugar O-acyltransferase (Sialic acid O-acetyltransferase NeuD family) n=1 Tax=Marinobacter pelagius TaxID=379482 RepID=A0A366G2U2_9GAMM|nr:acetyltransferase [Marinobacter pelagius]RBP20325.1 sugar O-acyltransferase (sialic acid O-acetyltransferase NeuD family) [Marinobacter pelagius]